MSTVLTIPPSQEDGDSSPAWTPIRQKTVVLTDSQIRAAQTIYEVVPATEVLNYDGFPTVIYVPVNVVLMVDTRNGAYQNVNPAATFTLAIGSDWSLDYSEVSAESSLSEANYRWLPMLVLGQVVWNTNVVLPINDVTPHQHTVGIGGPNPMATGLRLNQIYDNAISFVVSSVDGDLTNGHALNKITLNVAYLTVNLATGLLV